MGRQTGLIRRGKGYTLRVVVPKDVWGTFAAIWDRENPAQRRRRKGGELTQVWIALGEVERAKAVEVANLKRVWLDGLFREARAVETGTLVPVASPETVDLEAIHRAVKAYFYQLETEAPPVPVNEWEREDALESAIEDAGAEHTTPPESYSVQLVAKKVASDALLDIDERHPLFLDLVDAVKLALDEHASRQVERLSLETNPQRPRHPMLADISADSPQRAGLHRGGPPERRASAREPHPPGDPARHQSRLPRPGLRHALGQCPLQLPGRPKPQSLDGHPPASRRRARREHGRTARLGEVERGGTPARAPSRAGASGGLARRPPRSPPRRNLRPRGNGDVQHRRVQVGAGCVVESPRRTRSL